MTPKTRSGGAPAPSRVYHSTPSLQQARFPARKKVVTYGKKSSRGFVDKKQSTLTQINFVASSFSEDNAGVVELSDSEEDMEDGQEEGDEQDKENVEKKKGRARVVDEEEEEDEEPVASSGRKRRHGIKSKPRQTPKRTFFEDHNDSDATEREEDEDPISTGARKRRAPPSSAKSTAGTSRSTKNKRRRTMGDELPENARPVPSSRKNTKKGRRKTLGDTPDTSTSSSGFHTQTITQVVRRWDSTIKDSEDEDEDEDFDDWVGAPSPSPAQDSPTRHRAVTREKGVAYLIDAETATAQPEETREDSIIPQTPAKKKLRFAEDPSSSPLSSPPSSHSMSVENGPSEQLYPSSPSKGSSEATVTEPAATSPETPRGKTTRTEIPSSSQLSTPLSSNMLARYGPVSQLQPTPSKGGSQVTEQDQIAELPGSPGRRKLVIEDSFATVSSASLTQLKRTPLKDVTATMIPLKEASEEEEEREGSPSPQARSKESSSIPEAMSTPSRRPAQRRRNGSKDLGGDATTPSPKKMVQSQEVSRTIAGTGKKDLSNITEIPDSEAEDDDFWGESEVETQERNIGKEEVEQVQIEESIQQIQEDDTPVVEDSNAAEQHEEEATVSRETYIVGAETQGIFDELVMATDASNSEGAKSGLGTIEEEDTIPQSTAASSSSSRGHRKQAAPSLKTTTHPSPTLPTLPNLQAIRDSTTSSKPAPIRKPIRQPVLPSSPTQFIESQRVPLAVIQSLGGVSSQTDAFLITPSSQLDDLISGHRVDLSLPFRIPDCAVRFWLFDGTMLRYMACVGAGVQAANQWMYEVGQMYELNNPLDKESIDDEEWFAKLPPRYGFLPPAIVSQLLSNLKHALFDTDEDNISTQGTTQYPSSPVIHRNSQRSPPKRAAAAAAGRNRTTATTVIPSGSFSSASVSQQLEAQLRSETEQYTQIAPASDDDVLVPSTPIHDRTPRPTTVASPPPPPPAFTPRPLPPPSSSSQRRRSNWTNTATSKTPIQRRQPPIQASQATTASQASSPENPLPLPPPPPPPSTSSAQTRRPPLPQSSSLVFQDISSSSPHINNSNNSNSLGNASVSQLLTKSQMLSDSLLQDDVRVPTLEIWDSEEET